MSTITQSVNNNVVDYYQNPEGDLFLKYFLIDSSFNTREFSVDPSVTEKIARNSIGRPFTDYEDFPDTVFKDGHPWDPKPKATLKDHYLYAASKATGIIVDFSPVSRNALKSASGNDIQQNNGWYATIKVINPKRKEQYLKDPSRIPRCSPGLFDYDFTPAPAHNIKNVDIAHLAGVKYGAYGEKARVYASCLGGYECINHLKGASEFSSLGENSTQNTDIMSDQQSPLSNVPQNDVSNNELAQQSQSVQEQEQKPAQTITEEKVEIPTTNKEQSQKEETKAPFRLAKFDFQKDILKKEEPKQKESEIKVPSWKEDKEYIKLTKEVEELRKEKEYEKAKLSYAEIIPRELFILNGKFDVKGYNAELEKAVNKNIDKEYAKELYGLKLEKLKLNTNVGKPFGASNLENKKESYVTPNSVPELKGASDSEINSSQFAGLHNIKKMFGLIHSLGVDQ